MRAGGMLLIAYSIHGLARPAMKPFAPARARGCRWVFLMGSSAAPAPAS
jgi:hypothetical protein